MLRSADAMRIADHPSIRLAQRRDGRADADAVPVLDGRNCERSYEHELLRAPPHDQGSLTQAPRQDDGRVFQSAARSSRVGGCEAGSLPKRRCDDSHALARAFRHGLGWVTSWSRGEETARPDRAATWRDTSEESGWRKSCSADARATWTSLSCAAKAFGTRPPGHHDIGAAARDVRLRDRAALRTRRIPHVARTQDVGPNEVTRAHVGRSRRSRYHGPLER